MITARGSSTNLLIAGAGNETLTGAGSTGNNTFYTGSGNASITGGAGADVIFAGSGSSTIDGGAGADLIAIVNGRSGGSVVINGFDPSTGDRVTLQGYSAAQLGSALGNAQSVTSSNLASTQISLSDGTKITFAGVTNLSAGSFV